MSKDSVKESDRLKTRERPGGQPVMHQNWGKLHFLHWPIAEGLLRPLIPPDLHIDVFEDSAWIAITPFTMWDVRPFPPFMPAVPGLDSMHELNVRTYVHLDGVPGVWFFSLSINSSFAAVAARAFFHLPYYTAEIDLHEEQGVLDYQLNRSQQPDAQFHGRFQVGQKLPASKPGSKEFFLTERYVLYTQDGDGKLYRARIHHQPWPLQNSQMLSCSSTMLEANGIPSPTTVPLVHFASEVNVDIWAPEEL
jgi:uncharacterized protein